MNGFRVLTSNCFSVKEFDLFRFFSIFLLLKSSVHNLWMLLVKSLAAVRLFLRIT